MVAVPVAAMLAQQGFVDGVEFGVNFLEAPLEGLLTFAGRATLGVLPFLPSAKQALHRLFLIHVLFTFHVKPSQIIE